MSADISPDFRWNRNDAQTFKKILPHEATPDAIKAFARYAYRLSDYGYWFGLSTLWVNYVEGSELELWKELFSSTRPGRDTSLMKPSELETFRELPRTLTLYRSHRPAEQDWIAYTLLPIKAAEFAARRGIENFSEYRVSKTDALCLFLRRGEHEVLLLDKTKAIFAREIRVVKCMPEIPA